MNPFLYNFLNVFRSDDKNNKNGSKPKKKVPQKALKSKPNLKKLPAPKVTKKITATNPKLLNSNNLRKLPIKNLVKSIAKTRVVKKLNPFREVEKNVVLLRLEDNPIIKPKEDNWWEAWQTFNPGVVVLDNRVHLLYRAMGGDSVSRFGYAVSSDGYHVDDRVSNPVFEHKTKARDYDNGFYYSYHSGGSFAGAEDPCITYIEEDDKLYITYTACEDGLRVGLTTISREDFLKRNWKFSDPLILSRPGEIHKNWVIFPEKINGKYAILHNICKGIAIDYVDELTPQFTHKITSHDPQYNPTLRENCWDSFIRGTGTSPIKTKKGWLVFYHAMSKGDYGRYKIGAMLLDLNDPSKELFRSKYPVLEPNDNHHENCGCKPGIVYTKGAVVKDNKLLLYYGASDNYICVAYADMDDFLESLTHNRKPNLILKLLKKIKGK